MVLQHPRAGFPSHALEFKHCLIWCSARRWVDPSGQTSPASTDADCPAHETDNEHRHLPLCLRVAAARNRTFRCPDRRRRNLRRGSAYHLTTQLPGTSFVIQESFGGTWRTHRYPGIRSDSDLYTFGYRFKPWVGPPIASAEEILSYMGEVIEDNDLARHIRYGHTGFCARTGRAGRTSGPSKPKRSTAQSRLP